MYTYGLSTAAAATRTRGRVANRTDESGTEDYEYGRLGEVVVTRRKPVPQGAMSQNTTFVTQYDYDESFGRIKSMTFHDGEVVTYHYDTAGQLDSVIGERSGTQTTYVSKITYDDKGARRRLVYGNNVNTPTRTIRSCAA